MEKEHFLKRLTVNRPYVFEKYNYDLLPRTFLSTDKIPIDCYHHGVFYQKAISHLTGSGCTKCWNAERGDKRAYTTEEFIKSSKSRFGNKFDYSKVVYGRKNTEIKLICPTHGEIILTPDQHYWSKHGCQQCDFDIPRTIRKDKVLEKAKEIHKYKYDYGRVVFINMNDKVEIICPTHGSFWQNLYSHTAKMNGCPGCARQSDRLALEEFITKARTLHGDKYDYDKVKYDVGASLVTIVCKKHGQFNQRALSHLAGNGCKKCSIEKNKLSAEDFVNNAKQIHGDKYDYSKVIYHGNKKPVEIICRKHGSFWQKPNTHVSSRNGCNLCNESKGEVAVENFLKKYGIEYIREYRIKPYLYRYDFYLPKFDIYIEFHGQQHYKPVEQFGGYVAYLSCKKRDKAKKEIVNSLGSNLITLNYLNVQNDSVDNELIFRLKKIYRHWFLINGKITVYKTTMDAINAFKLPSSTVLKNTEMDILNKRNDVSVLF